MAKPEKRIRARNLRKSGESLKDIARALSVSKSSVSGWCSDISLTPQQVERLHEKMVKGSYIGRMRGAETQKRRKREEIESFRKQGVREVGFIRKRDLLILGIGLYLGEGNKNETIFQFTNSDPRLVNIFLLWLERIVNVKREDLILRVMINHIHKKRAGEVQKHWSQTTRVPLNQFRKTTFIKSKNKKVYENFENHFGTLAVRARRGTRLQYKILGLCYGLLKKTEAM